MSEFVLNILQSGFIQELENTSSLSEQIKKLDYCIGRIEENKKMCAEKVKQHEEYEKLLEEYEKQLEEQKKLLDKNMKESNDEAGAHEIQLTFFRTLRQKLVEFSSIPPSTHPLAPPPESSMRPPIDPLALSLGSLAQSRYVYPPPPESFVPPPTHPFTTAQSRFVNPPPRESFMPPPTYSFTTAQSRFVNPPPPESFVPPPAYSLRPPAFPVPPPPTASNFPPPPESFVPPPTYSLPPPAFPVPPPATASNFPQPSRFANPPWVSYGPQFSGPQPTWGPLYGPVAPVQEEPQVLEPRSRFQWTEERARAFDEAVIAVGGLHNATPRSIKQAMVINEDITEKQISSRLQKIRGKYPRLGDV